MKITKDIVQKVKMYADKEKYGNLTKIEISKLVGISDTSVGLIIRGDYDKLLDEPDPITGIGTVIPYEEFNEMVKAKYVIYQIFAMALTSDKDLNAIYLPRKPLNDLLWNYYPDIMESVLEKLNKVTAE